MGAVILWLDGAAVVTSVNPLGPAGLSGEVLVGDQIAEVGGTAVTSVEQARALIVGPSNVPRGCDGCTPRSFHWHPHRRWFVSLLTSCLLVFFRGKQSRAEAEAQYNQPRIRHVSRADRTQAVHRPKLAPNPYPSPLCCSVYSPIILLRKRNFSGSKTNRRCVADQLEL
jgi:hypothetical protein